MYPYYITGESNEFEMSYWCHAELSAWRAAKLRHRAAKSAERKLAVRPDLERAFAALRVAYMAAINQDVACVV